MSDDATLAPAGDISVVSAGTDAPESFNSPTSAAKYLIALREKEQPAESATEPATADQSEPKGDDASPVEATGETQANDQATEPPIEPPKSWSKEAKERWSSYTRDAQEELARVEQGREREFLRGQQEAAEAARAAKAQEAQWRQEHSQTVAKQAAYTQALETALQDKFGDIRSTADITKMRMEDPFRFLEWQEHQMLLGQAQAERRENEQRSLQEKQSKRSTYEAEQNKRLIELVPEMAEPTKANVLRERVITMLTDDLGMAKNQLESWYADDTGHEILSNAGMQKLMADGLKYRDLLSAPRAVAAKPVPPVQRPGPSAPRGAAQAQDLRTHSQRLTETGSIKDAVALLIARRKAS